MMDATLEELIGRLRTNADAKRTRAIEAVESEYLTDMNCIERLIALDTGNNGSATAAVQPPVAPVAFDRARLRPQRDKTGPTAATREAVAILPDGYSVRDVDAAVQRRHPNAGITRLAIFSALNKLVAAKKIEKVTESQGREPGTYRTVNRDSALNYAS